MSFRGSMLRELSSAGCLADAGAVWLMWPGYLENEAGRRAGEALSQAGIQMTVVHASGHAPVKDLQRLAAAVDADTVVPIHTSTPERFVGLFERVTQHADGEWWEVG